MIVFPNAKINLGLHITSKRADGYHNIESVFIPIPVNDVLEITENKQEKTVFTSTGITIPSDGKPNLVEQAWQLLKNEFDIPAVDLDLLKIIPIGAGLGGGSADAAACLQGLNTLFNLQLPQDKLLTVASNLGADCAFFIKNKAVFAKGVGNDFSAINFDLNKQFENLHIVIIYPNIHVSTPLAYKHVTPKSPKHDILKTLQLPIKEWKNKLVNDFEDSVFKSFPEIESVKNQLYKYDAIYAAMSGSGSTLFGVFKNKPELDELKGYKRWDFTF